MVQGHVTYHKLPGDRFATERRRDLPSLAAAVVRFLNIGSRRPLAAIGDDLDFAIESAKWSRAVLRWLDIDLDASGTDRVDWDDTCGGRSS